MKTRIVAPLSLLAWLLLAHAALSQTLDIKQTPAFRRIKAHLDATPAIDTHDQYPASDLIRGRVETGARPGIPPAFVWQSSYYTWFNPLSPWPKSGAEDWWSVSARLRQRPRHEFIGTASRLQRSLRRRLRHDHGRPGRGVERPDLRSDRDAR
jgi:hypothetical protein